MAGGKVSGLSWPPGRAKPLGMTGHAFIFGYGYAAGFLARRLVAAGWRVSGAMRSAERAGQIEADGATAHVVTAAGVADAATAFAEATHIVQSAPPGAEGDPLLLAHGAALARGLAPKLAWAGYLSTTGVYGDADGGWVDESAPLNPIHEKARRRVAAEEAWTRFGGAAGVPVSVFRLPGIYGPGRSAFDALRKGTARRLVKPGQVFSRVHVEDIAGGVAAAMAARAGGVFNLADDEPAPPQDVVTHAARLLGVEPPPEQDFETAKAALSPMALEFYGANRRIANGAMKAVLGAPPRFPSYREGLAAILRDERNGG